jgi:tetratricopeptide (TPR) repeat protein
LNALGYTLVDRTRRYDEAQKYLDKALSLEPDEAVIIDSYGWLQYKLNNLDAALEYLQRAYSLQQENEIAGHLLEVLWRLERKDEARELFDRVIKDAPDDEYLLDIQRRIFNAE